MAKDNKTLFDGDKTKYDSAKTIYDDMTVLDISETVPDGVTVPDDAQDSEGVLQIITIEKGSTLLDTYQVESDAIEGGMGRVWHVHHTGWNVSLAMKQPKAALFQTEKQKENFITECEAWINLGLHPHIVSCYYVREIGGIPTIFSEWMEVGSLKNIIEDGSLYKGDVKEQQERILDIAIQFARGLHYAHEQGLIHQDVKPDNLLLTKNGEAKVADFGIAKARAELTALDVSLTSDGTIVSQSGGYTPAYCSMEQMNGEKLTRRTDIYSWAVSVMEMYLGERPWLNGVIAGAACQSYFKDARVEISEGMRMLLCECLNEDEAKRPRDFTVVENTLLEIYKEVTGEAYARTKPKAAADTADSLNNKALSFLDMGRHQEAERCWEEAFRINPQHNDSLYNRSLYQWRKGLIDDTAAIRRVREGIIGTASWRTNYLLSLMYMERSDPEAVIQLLEQAAELSGGLEHVLSMLDLARALPAAKKITVIENIKIKEIFKKTIGSHQYILRDKDIAVLDVNTGAVVRSIRCPDGSADHMDVSCDGRFILIANKETLSILDNETGTQRSLFTGKKQYPYFVRFTCDGKYAAALVSGTMKKWDAETGECVVDISEPALEAFDLSPDGRYAVTGAGNPIPLGFKRDYSKAARVWDLDTGKLVCTLKEHKDTVAAVCFLNDGERVVTGSWDTTIKLWDIKAAECLHTFYGHTGQVLGLVIDSKERYMLSHDHNSVKLWDLHDKKCLHTFEGSGKGIDAAWFDCHKPRIFMCRYDNILGSREIIAHEIPEFAFHAEWTLSSLSSTSGRLGIEKAFAKACACAGKLLLQNDIQGAFEAIKKAEAMPGMANSARYQQLKAEIGKYCIKTALSKSKEMYAVNVKDTPECIRFLGDDRIVFGCDNCVYIIDSHSGKDIWNFEVFHKEPGSNSKVRNICISADGKEIWAADPTKNILRCWDAREGKFSRSVPFSLSDEQYLKKFVLAPKGTLAYLALSDGRIHCIDLRTGKTSAVYKACSDNIVDITVSPDGKTIACASQDLKVYVMGAFDGHIIRTILITRNPYASSVSTKIAFSPDGKFICTGPPNYGNNMVFLWDLGDDRVYKEFAGHTNGVLDCCFSADGRHILSASADGTVKLWSFESEKCLYTWTMNENYKRICSISLSPDNRMMALGTNDKMMHLYQLDWEIEFPGWASWDEGARPYLEAFLALHSDYTDADFQKLVSELQNRGLGWLKTEGVRSKLKEMALRQNTGSQGIRGKKK